MFTEPRVGIGSLGGGEGAGWMMEIESLSSAPPFESGRRLRQWTVAHTPSLLDLVTIPVTGPANARFWVTLSIGKFLRRPGRCSAPLPWRRSPETAGDGPTPPSRDRRLSSYATLHGTPSLRPNLIGETRWPNFMMLIGGRSSWNA